jgi:hypothetical protein
MYEITNYTKQQAKRLGINIKFSHKPTKKIDVFDKNWLYICSIGDRSYSDYPTYIKTHGLEYANARRTQYKRRHAKDRNRVGTPGYFAARLLWGITHPNHTQ